MRPLAGLDAIFELGHRVAHTGTGNHVSAGVGIFSQLASKPRDIHAQEMSLILVTISPYAEKDVLLGERAPHVLAQARKEAVLSGRQRDLAPTEGHKMLGVIDQQRPVLQHGRMSLIRGEACAAEHGAYPR